MAQQPAVVIIARHGPRLDAANQSWHLSTPTPYDPPLTYGGWNQSRALGVRIASLLHAREQAVNENVHEHDLDLDGVTIHDFARQDGAGGQNNGRKRKRKHKVVIHSSPFLRCLQTSVAIAAGMAQYQPPSESGNRPGTNVKSRTPNSMRSASPRLRALDGMGSPTLAPIAEPKHDFAHAIARRALHEHKRHRKAKMRVDAFLGEWLNPSYFDHITPPPPSAMMVATAKAELMQNEPVDIFTPTLSTKASNSSLWSGSHGPRQPSRESTVDDFSDMHNALPSPSPRSRSSSFSSVGSNEGAASSADRRRSPRPSHALPRTPSSLPKPETTVYVPPIPQYAVSAADYIPRGYVAHARQACVNVDYQWDSSRPPQQWEDGGEYGEEWSAMHKRFRRGLNHLIHWYSQHDADDRAEDSLSFEQADKHEDEEQEEELVLILVTHGAGSNALIGALTGQPVLLDVGMASLTMAVRRDDAPHITTYASSTAPSAAPSPSHTPAPDHQQWHGQQQHHAPRRGSLDLGLASIYEMKLVSSSEHLRPGADPTKGSTPPTTFFANHSLANTANANANGVGSLRGSSGSAAAAHAQFRLRFGASTNGSGVERGGDWSIGEAATARSSTSTALGSVLRPSAISVAAHHTTATPAAAEAPATPTPPFSPGLWTPPASRTPLLQGETMPLGSERTSGFGRQLHDGDGDGDAGAGGSSGSGRGVSPGRDLVLDFSNSPPDSRPSSSSSGWGAPGAPQQQQSRTPTSAPAPSAFAANAGAVALNGTSGEVHSGGADGGLDGATSDATRAAEQPAPPATPATNGRRRHMSKQHADNNKRASLSAPPVADVPPLALSRSLSQKGLWGTKPAGVKVTRRFEGLEPKRRWSVGKDDAAGAGAGAH
ncbi:hypothetical protein LTR36_009207 [Oleoguttula mirabilis]|uniref:Phosphoglycerate mutase n=1 Tax=Oleoguttula mirabilis TaxID=1507867 RepID=A0AAV9J6G0_9PEZI|nr:hypothetical protein LTR36_009207 [Oleoguttula mirabilis]